MADNMLPLFAGSGKFYVYVYRDPRPRKKLAPIYVGKGTAANKRADDHWRNRTHNHFLESVLKKIRRCGLTPPIEIVAWTDDEQSALDLECSFISKFGRRSDGTGNLCNLTSGGEGTAGLKWSEESRSHHSEIMRARMSSSEKRAAISEKLKGRKIEGLALDRYLAAMAARVGIKRGPMSDEQREKIRVSKTGQRASQETKDKMRASHIGSKRSAETKEKMSAAAKRVQGESRKRVCATDDGHAKMVAISRKAAEDPEVRAKRSENAKRLWADPDYRARRMEPRSIAGAPER